MADISSYISAIETASRGEAVRDAIINALDAINTSGGNASSLGGLSYSSYVTTTQLNGVVNEFKGKLDTINGETANSIDARLTLTSNTKAAIRSAIENKGVNVSDSDTFASYAEKIASIDGSGSGYTYETLEVTENGEYEEDNKAYTKVIVDVEANELLTEKYISDNGTYTALLDGYDGFSSVVVNIPGGSGGPYTVQFVNTDGTVLSTVTDVPHGGSADPGITSAPTDGTGRYWIGWNPYPLNVRSNMTCVAKYADYGVSPQEITDSWATIAANGGGNYKIGDFKTLSLGQYTYEDVTYDLGDLVMQKVYAGEGGSVSTWVSMNVLRGMYTYGPVTIEPDGDWLWQNSWLRTTLCFHVLLEAFPAELRRHLFAVTKYTRGLNVVGYVTSNVGNAATQDLIWVPSSKELGDTWSDFLTYESKAPVYSRIYSDNSSRIKSYQGDGGVSYITRSGCKWHSRYGFYTALINADGSLNNYGEHAAIGEGSTTSIPIGFCLTV